MCVCARVCMHLYVRVSVRSRNLQNRTIEFSQNVLCMLIVAVAMSFSLCVVKRHVLPVFAVSCFHTVGSMACHVYVYTSTTVPPTSKVTIEH